jgi:hypothetical protein
MVASDEYRASRSRHCGLAALFLCLMHFLTIAGMAYQNSLVGSYDELAINYGLWLSPILVVILIKRKCALVWGCAIPILIDFAARMYYTWQYYSLGVNSMGQKGDWATWLTAFMAMFSIVIAALWLLIGCGAYIAQVINRSRGARIEVGDGKATRCTG